MRDTHNSSRGLKYKRPEVVEEGVDHGDDDHRQEGADQHSEAGDDGQRAEALEADRGREGGYQKLECTREFKDRNSTLLNLDKN